MQHRDNLTPPPPPLFIVTSKRHSLLKSCVLFELRFSCTSFQGLHCEVFMGTAQFHLHFRGLELK